MELFPPLTGFYKAISEDARIGATHISIYMALLQQWNLNGGSNSFTIERNLVMQTAKIASRQTYNKCMNELAAFGYILYKPAANNSSRSQIFLKI